MNTSAIQVIDALGGTAAVARIFEVSMPSVSAWKEDGIPPARMMFLRFAYKKALACVDLHAATAKTSRNRVVQVQSPQELAQPSTSTKEVGND